MKGISSLAYILFLVSFTSIVVFLIAQVATAPAPAVSQPVLKFNASSNTSYFVNVQRYNNTLIDNVPDIDSDAITCDSGYFVIDGVVGCIWNYGSTFLAYASMQSTNPLMAILLSIMAIGAVWAVITLWGGS